MQILFAQGVQLAVRRLCAEKKIHGGSRRAYRREPQLDLDQGRPFASLQLPAIESDRDRAGTRLYDTGSRCLPLGL